MTLDSLYTNIPQAEGIQVVCDTYVLSWNSNSVRQINAEINFSRKLLQIQQHALATAVWMCDGHESRGRIFKYIYGKDRRTNSRKESAQTTGLETLY